MIIDQIDAKLLGRGRTAEIFLWEDKKVLKLFYEGYPLQRTEREANVTRIVANCGIFTPNAYEVIEVDGRMGIILDRIEGRSMLSHFSTNPLSLPKLATGFAETHLLIHSKKSTLLPDFKQELISTIVKCVTLAPSIIEMAVEKIKELPNGNTILHGDYHPDNLIIDQDRNMTIDWATATSGPAAADVAITSLLLRIGVLPEKGFISRLVATGRHVAHDLYLQKYLKNNNKVSIGDVNAWEFPLAVTRYAFGIPEEKKSLLSIIREHSK